MNAYMLDRDRERKKKYPEDLEDPEDPEDPPSTVHA